MPGLYRDEGVVLRTIKLGEADRIATLFTRDNGKVRAVVKGVRKTKSRFGARLEPYTRVEMLIYRGRGDLDTITSADIVEAHPGLHKDFDRMTTAAVMAELIEKISPDREASFSSYSLLAAGLRSVAEGRGPSVLPAFIVKLLSVSGFHPELLACAGCGNDGFLGGFSPSLGGAVCKECWVEDQDAYGVAPDRLDVMHDLLAGDFGVEVDGPVIDEVTALLSRYAEYHLERPLKSMQLLRAV